MEKSVLLTTYEPGKPIKVNKIKVILNDHSYDDFIQKVYRIFLPLRLTGPISPKTTKIDEQIKQMIREGDNIYLPPALVGHYLAEKKWEGIDVNDGAFMIDNHPWVTPEEWYSFMPFMIEFLLTADRWVDAKYEFFIYMLAGLDAKAGDRTDENNKNYIRKSEREFLKSEKWNKEMTNCILEFLEHFKEKYKNDLGDFLLDEIGKAKTWWMHQIRV